MEERTPSRRSFAALVAAIFVIMAIVGILIYLALSTFVPRGGNAERNVATTQQSTVVISSPVSTAAPVYAQPASPVTQATYVTYPAASQQAVVVVEPTKNPALDIAATIPANEFPEFVQADRDATIALQTALSQKGYALAIDGEFGPATGNAVVAFQKANKLTVDGLAGKETFRSAGTSLPSGVRSLRYCADLETIARISSRPYIIYIDTQSKVNGKTRPTLSVYGKQADGHWALLYCRLCGIGNDDTPTTFGVFQIYSASMDSFDRGSSTSQWNFPSWFNGEIGIHTTTFSKSSKSYTSTDDQIGKKVSHGCVRVEPELAKWIQETCGLSTYVCVDARMHDATLTGLPTNVNIYP
ncbi:murein L,D-transpeptidase [Candidatus Saccharibacteria bacterium]|nr:murein L,D-transpeptidase [Candidatus Saccharibacteria bacterium]